MGTALFVCFLVSKMPPQLAAERALGLLDAILANLSSTASSQQAANLRALYVEKIDLGEDGGPRTVVSGLVKHYPLEEMQNRRVLVVCNLKPAKMRGVESQGMVLCATGEDGKVEFVEPPEGVPNGERVLFPGYTDVAGIADPESPFMHPKKKMWEAVQVDLAVSGGVATYKGVPFGTTGGACRPRSVPSGEIR